MFVSQAESQAESQEIELQTVEARVELGNGEREDGEEREERGEGGGREGDVNGGNNQEKEMKSEEGRGEEEGGGGEGVEGGAGEESSITSDVVRKFQQQLEEIKVAPRYI